MSDPVRHDPEDPARRPRTLGQRMQLLLVLLVLPLVAVTIPTLLITGVFGQRPRPKPAAVDTNGLGAALNRSAVSLLPTPAPLTPDPIVLRVRPDHIAARAEKVTRQAQGFSGSAVEGVANPGEKHLFVDLPAGTAAAFRRALAENTIPASPAGSAVVGVSRDQLEVIIRGIGDDE